MIYNQRTTLEHIPANYRLAMYKNDLRGAVVLACGDCAPTQFDYAVAQFSPDGTCNNCTGFDDYENAWRLFTTIQIDLQDGEQ